MSASPPPAVASTKRPLEDSSSPAGPHELPDAKRQALDKDAHDSQDDKLSTLPTASQLETTQEVDTSVPNMTSDESTLDQSGLTQQEKPKPIPSAIANFHTNSQTNPMANQDESQWVHVRSVISSAEAATVIGKGGENVSQIRRMSGAKCTVSDYARGAVERILTVSGAQDAVAKAFGLIIRTLNNEGLEAPSTAQSKTYPLRLLIPHILIGSIIGKSGVRIREIQEASGSRLNVSDACLPLSTERSLVVLGVADAVHIATYYIAVTLVEQLTERFGGPAASAYATRSGGPAGVVPGGMQVVPYVPQPAGGQYGPPDMYRRHGTQPPQHQAQHTAYAQYSQLPPQPHQQYAPQPVFAASPVARQQSYGGGNQSQPSYGQVPQQPTPQAQAHPQIASSMPGQPITQQIFIPNDMVGAIIGKGGAKINEIRHLSGSVIKINEPQDNNNERLVTISGTQECNQMALYMLYQRLGESKKDAHKK